MSMTTRSIRTRQSLRSVATLAAAIGIAVTLAACSAQGSWFQPRSPTTSLQASKPCPASTGKARDVRNTGRSNGSLVPSGTHPITGLICIYGGPLNASTPVRQIVLNSTKASRLAAALSVVSLQAPPSGPVNCPADTGRFAIIAFSFAKPSASDIWWTMTGCQTLDNGTLGATQIANKSFAKFRSTITEMID